MRIVYGLGLLGAACLFACGSSSKGGGPSGSAGDGSGGIENVAGAGNHRAGSSGAGDAGDGNETSAGAGGDAGSGDMPPVVSSAKPHAAGGLVAGGTVGHSAHFTGVFSLGAGPGGNGLSTSKSQQLRGGVIGASQK
jgi:hypothetical protein